MAIQNNLANSSLRKYLPSRVISGLSITVTPLESWLYDDGLGDPWWQGATGAPYRWLLTAEVYVANHSSHVTRVPNQYNGVDIQTGMWVFANGDAKAVRIRSIVSQTDDQIQCIVEDVDRYNTFNDPASSGTGVFSELKNLIFFEVGDEGYPLLDPMPDGFTDSTINQVVSRFRKFNSNLETRFFQLNHGFKEGQVLKIDQTTRQFVNATSNDIYVVGTVTGVGPGPNFFYLAPSTKVISNLSPGLPGGVGDIIWLDPITGDRTNVPSGPNPVYIKLTRAAASFGVGSVPNPTTWEGTTIKLNSHPIIFALPEANSLDDIRNEINSHFTLTGVFAGLGAPPTIQEATVEYPMSTPATDLRFTLNGVQIVVAGPSVTFGTSGDIGWWDVVRSINEQTNAHGVTASFDANTGKLTFVNSSGGNINFANVTPSTTSGADKSFTDMVGVTSKSGDTPDRLMLVRSDGGPITLTDVMGSFTTDVGLKSVANGSLPLALVVDKTMNSSGNYVVPNIEARDALDNLTTGDQVFVQSAEDGEWALFVLVGVQWIKLADADSASSDANTMIAEFDFESTTPVNIGTVSNNARIANVTIVVSEAFDGTATISVGVPGDPAVIMSSDIVDLTVVGSYETSSSYTYFGVPEGVIQATLDTGGSTQGQAKIIISYL
jgi:hypothetical protein